MFLGGSFGITDTRLAFGDDRHYDFRSQALAAFVGYRLGSGWSLQGAVGAILGGELVGDEIPGTFDIGTGVMASITAARRWALGDGRWFINGSASFALARSPTEEMGGTADDPLLATDLRIGATAGRTFADRVSPYALVRLFGGPALWTIAGEDATGSDPSHLQLGAGVSVVIAAGVSALVDVSVLGERSVAAGLSLQL